MKTPLIYTGFCALFLSLTACDALEKTDLIRSEPIIKTDGRTLMYEMYLTGTDKYRYNYLLIKDQDTTQLFEAKLTDRTANTIGMEVEQTKRGFKIILDKPIENQQKTVDGVTYELEGTKE